MNTKRSNFKDRRRRKKGVSPVIGVILMVAATIVIAAVVLAMLGGFTAPTRSYVVTATAVSNATGTGISVTYQGGPDSDLVDKVYAMGKNLTSPNDDQAVELTSVGSSIIFHGTKGAANDHIVVNAIVKGTNNWTNPV